MFPYKTLNDEESSLRPQPTILELPFGARLRNSVYNTSPLQKWVCAASLLLLILMIILCFNFTCHEVVTLQTNRILCQTNEKFLSVALDTSLIQERWSHLNISSPKFLLMAKYLAPGYLRIGGTMADRLIFDANSTDLPPQPDSSYVDQQLKQANEKLSGSDPINETAFGITLIDGDVWSYCDKVNNKTISNFTMTGNDWIAINNFATSAGLKLMFDLNVLLRNGDNWNSSNALELIKFSDQHCFDIDWQLGNEPNSFQHVFNVSITGAQLAKDFIALKNILKTFPRYETSLLVGPDVTRPKLPDDPAVNYLTDFLHHVNNSISAVAWHQYYLNGHTAHLKDITPESLNVLYSQIDQVRTAVRGVYNKSKTLPPPIWLSETGSAYGGGAWGLSDSFVAGFLWLDKLGVAAREGINVVVRQSLYHGYYSLLDEKTLNPLPDWWLSIIYKTFVSPKVIKASTLLGPVRIYCHCTPSKIAMSPNGTVTVFGLNMLNNNAVVTLKGLPKRSGDSFVNQYILTGEDGLGSKSVLLNGVRLELKPDGGLPPFKPVATALKSELTLPPLSLGFFVLHGVVVPACSEIVYFS